MVGDIGVAWNTLNVRGVVVYHSQQVFRLPYEGYEILLMINAVRSCPELLELLH